MPGQITDIPGIRVGHYTDKVAATGCTVVLCEKGATGGISVRGSAPGTRETDLLRPGNLVEKVHAIFLSGGSAFGLDAAAGVMRFLEERQVGFETSVARVPIVPAAIIFDLAVGNSQVRPGPREGYQACLASSADRVVEGSVGAGTGATVGKALGIAHATKGGLGTASLACGGLIIGALVVVNAFGDIIDPATGQIVAGPRRPDGGFYDTLDLLKSGRSQAALPTTNTTLGVVATNAWLTKEQANKMADMAQDGLARAVRPAHTMVDGDVIFALATGEKDSAVDMTFLGALAAEVVAQAILRAIGQAEGLAGIPAAREVKGAK